ncbi:unnamed protein product [Dibothriocephalus latus]|uniref:Uncharacterized protein n=1 Tax=Dibothriocephalus latus TaxID=60516 RepID=A0A3P7L9A0_DIBLA|nr:unnamed protein product [Dibothriocephalus latus]
MQRKLINKNLKLEFLLHDEKNNDTPDIKPARTVEAETVDLCRDSNNLRTLAVLGPASVEARFRALKKKKAASVYCVICQEEVTESSENGLVVGALAARSSVVSMPPPCARAVFSDSGNTTNPKCYTSVDNLWA